MDNTNLIRAIYRILLNYERSQIPNSDSTENTYNSYLDRLYVRFLGWDNEEIRDTIKGLYILGLSATHQTVRSVVFHLIDIIKKEEVTNGV